MPKPEPLPEDRPGISIRAQAPDYWQRKNKVSIDGKPTGL
jgi:hypothetical protein